MFLKYSHQQKASDRCLILFAHDCIINKKKKYLVKAEESRGRMLRSGTEHSDTS